MTVHPIAIFEIEIDETLKNEESEERDEEKAWLVGRERQSQNRFISSLNAFLI